MEIFARMWTKDRNLPEGCAVTQSQEPTSLGLLTSSQEASLGQGEEIPREVPVKGSLISIRAEPAFIPGLQAVLSLAVVPLSLPTPNLLLPQTQKHLGPEREQSQKQGGPPPEASNQSSGSQLKPPGGLLRPVSQESPCWCQEPFPGPPHTSAFPDGGPLLRMNSLMLSGAAGRCDHLPSGPAPKQRHSSAEALGLVLLSQNQLLGSRSLSCTHFPSLEGHRVLLPRCLHASASILLPPAAPPPEEAKGLIPMEP